MRLKKEKIDELLGAIANLEAIDIPEQNMEIANNLTIDVSGGNFGEILVIGDQLEGEKQYFIKKQNHCGGAR